MTRQQFFTKQLLTTGVAVTATLALSAPVLADPDAVNMVVGPQCDVVFGVNDARLNDSQIVFMGGDGTGVTPLGVEYPDHDLEAMDIDKNNVLYVASGDDSVLPGHLFKVNKATAEITDLGKLCVREADGISFNLIDNTLWGWGQDEGLFRVLRSANGELDLSTCRIVLPGSDEIEDLTWDNAGAILYGVGNVSEGAHDATVDSTTNPDTAKPRAVVAYTPATGAISQICRAVMEPVTDEIEGVEMQPDGTIMFTYHNRDKVSVYGYIDPNSCEMWEGVAVENATPFNDIEALACCVDQSANVPWTYQKDYVGDATGDSFLEIRGMAVKIDNGVMTVAINAGMDANGRAVTYAQVADKHVGFSDMVFDFGGKKYAVKFATDNDSGVASTGLYENITLKDVTAENYGWDSFIAYNRGDLGALPIHNDYFSWEAKRSVPESIKTGTKVGDITALNAAQLAAMGLNFAGANPVISGGAYTFGFSFTMTAGMKGDFLAYFFTECINDGMVIRVPVPPSC